MPAAATDTTALRPALEQGGAALGVVLGERETDKLLAFLALLARWTQVYNLTAVRDPAEMLRQHLLDSLSVVRPIQEQLRGLTHPRLLDVGSGGGLPGVVLALLCPEVHITCVDTVGKKATFIRQAAAELGLRNLTAEHNRVEALAPHPGYDVITARAFSSLPTLCGLTQPLLKSGAVWAAMKGQLPQEEIDALPSSIDVFHVEQLTVPGLDARRCLVWMRPASTHN